AHCTGGIHYVIGVDEAGRGALAGPLVAGAVLLADVESLRDVEDSKRLSPVKRVRLAELIREQALAFGVGWVSPSEIGRRGVDWANRTVFTRARHDRRKRTVVCTRENTIVIVDGTRPAYRCPFEQINVKGGDRTSLAGAAASILAKPAR